MAEAASLRGPYVEKRRLKAEELAGLKSVADNKRKQGDGHGTAAKLLRELAKDAGGTPDQTIALL